jgi:hypothetical protein
MVLLDENVHWQVIQHDLTLMIALAAVERMLTQWTALGESVGLRIQEVYMYNSSTYESVLAVVPK